MGDKNFDNPAATNYVSRSTNDRGLEGFSSHMDNRGLHERKLDNAEDLSSIFRDNKIIGCTNLPPFEPTSQDLSAQQIKGLKAIAGLYVYPGFDSTACLCKIAALVWGNVGSVYHKDARAYFDIIEILIAIRDELEKRTKAPYRLAFEIENRKPLPAAILAHYPFSEYKKWKETSSNRKSILSGKAVILEPIPIKDEKAKQVDKIVQVALDKSLKRLEEKIGAAQLLSDPRGDSPIVGKAIHDLSKLSVGSISRQTDVKFQGLLAAYSGNKLIEFTELIIYNSVYSVILDKTGDPFVMPDWWDYPILVPPPEHVMERHIPPPGRQGIGALYISVAKYGDANFIINDGQVKKMLLGGVAGFVENSGGGIFHPHEFQEKIQAYLDKLGGLNFVASISVSSAVDRNSLSVDSIIEKGAEVITAALPYTILELGKRLEGIVENYRAFLQEVGEGIIRTLIIEKARKMIIEFLVKKIGAKLVPLINAVSVAYDAFTGEKEREQVKHAIAYMLLAIKGKEKDDMTIAAKGLSKIIADKVQDRIVAELVSRGAHKVKQTVGHKKPVSKSAPQKANLDQPAAAKPKLPESDSKSASSSTSQKKPYDVLTDSTQQEWAEAEAKVKAAKQKAASEPESESSQQGKSTRKTDDKATEGKETAGQNSRGTAQPLGTRAGTGRTYRHILSQDGKLTRQHLLADVSNDKVYVYRLMDDHGNVIKYGTTANPLQRTDGYARDARPSSERETFTKMEVFGGPMSRFESLQVETDMINSGLELDHATLNARKDTQSEMLGGRGFADITHKPNIHPEQPALITIFNPVFRPAQPPPPTP